ncbi:hypothetical protein FDECE_9375 [Fusarium decemcellulare]|nr:hypothetical protein FDECE_9375 [Fusarium decemcellulare]
MTTDSWPAKFVGSHILVSEPGKQGDSWDTIPVSWKEIRFDAVDVLFISPFFVKTDDSSFVLGPVEGGSLLARFNWVIQAARSKNPSVKIILEQFYTNGSESDYRSFKGDETKIKKYADSVASFIESYYVKSLPALSGGGEISARIDGFDVDVESSTLDPDLPKVLTAVRKSLDTLGQKLNADKFTVSITPAWTDYLDASVAQSCDYLNMQNYSGGVNTSPEDYLKAVQGLKKEQLVWGFTSEEPWRNTLKPFPDVKAKAQEVVGGHLVGVYTWRLNSDNYVYESIFQVWLYNLVHGASLPDAKDESVVAKGWPSGGRNNDGQ